MNKSSHYGKISSSPSKRNRNKPINYGLYLMVLAIILTFSTSAQIIVPSTQPDVVLDFWNTTGVKASVNCDMLETPDGNIKAVVTSHGGGTELYVIDNTGAVATSSSNLNMVGSADVVLGVESNPVTHVTEYRVGVLGTEGGGTGHISLRVYNLVNVGTSSFNIVPNGIPVWLELNNGVVGPYPHIDMFADKNALVNGLPSLHRFGATWTENGQLMCMTNELSTPSLPTAPPWAWWATAAWWAIATPYASNPVCYEPDIACTKDFTTGMEEIHIVYGIKGNGSTISPDLMLWEAVATGAPPVHTTLHPSVDVFSARIEALSFTNSGSPNPTYQVVASVSQAGSGQPYQVYGYNDKTPSFPTLLSDLFLPPISTKAPAVAAGIGPMAGSFSNIGNAQYTVGFYPYNAYISVPFSDVPYARNINVLTGLTTNNNSYKIPSTYGSNAYDPDPRNLALSNCSNSGKDILSAWHLTPYLSYKISPNSMSFRNSPTATGLINTHSGVSLYPNPAQDVIHISGMTGKAYSIIDFTGKAVLRGIVKAENEMVDIHSLSPGIYVLNIVKNGVSEEGIRFERQ